MKCYSPYTALFIALFLCVASLQAQEQYKSEILLGFVKTTSLQSSDSLYFNVLKLQNTSNRTLVIVPELKVPECFSLMSMIPKKIKLQPGKIKHIPFRISISKTAFSNTPYQIQAEIVSEQNKKLAQSSCQVNIRERRDWSLSVDDTELIFSGEKNTGAEFEFRLINLGNTEEKIRVNIEIPEGFKPAAGNRQKDFNIQLLPGVDSVISYQVIQKQNNQKLNISDNIKLHVYNDNKQYNERIRISCYSNYFEYSPGSNKANSYIEYSRRSFNNLNEIKDELRTKGIVPLKNDNKILYSFSNYDLKNTEEFWERSYYQLIFEGKNYSGGIGQHYSNLLLDAYNSHSVFSKWKIPTGKKNEIELYASQGLDYNITSVAAGHQLIIDRVVIKTSAGYNEDNNRRQKSKSAIFSALLPITSKHKLNLNARGIERDYFKDSLYTLSGMQGNWSYFGKMTPRLFMNLKNRFQTKGYYSGNHSDNLLDASMNYQVTKNSRLLMRYTYNTKKGGSSNYDVTDHLLNASYEFKTSQNKNIRTGLWLEEYSNEETNITRQIRSCNLWMQTSCRNGRMDYSFAVMTGYRFQENTVIENEEVFLNSNHAPNFQLEGYTNFAPFSVRCSYINGSQKSSSLSQRSKYNELRISPTLHHEFFRDKVLFDLQADYEIDWVRKSQRINIRPKVSMVFKNDWSVLCDAYISAYGKQSVIFSTNTYNTNLKISLRKDFKFSKKSKKEKFHKMEMIFYRDDNKNGIRDNNENGIEKSLVSIGKKRNVSDEKHVQLSKLVSQHDGAIVYENLPEGSYELNVNQLASTDGYFNFDAGKMELNLNKDTTYFIAYIKAYKIEGKLELKRMSISSNKVGQISNIKVTATDSKGKTFSCLTNSSGHYQLAVAGKDKYVVSIHNPYGQKILVKNNNAMVDFSEKEMEIVNFEFVEKRRKVNMKRSSLSKDIEPKPSEQVPQKLSISNTHKSEKVKGNISQTNLFNWNYKYYNEETKLYENYSVVGAFEHKNYAENYRNELVLKNTDAFIFFDKKKNLHYVCINAKAIAADNDEEKSTN